MVDYQKLYAGLVGRVDDALQYMEQDPADTMRMLRAMEMLKAALLAAEEQYMAAEETEE